MCDYVWLWAHVQKLSMWDCVSLLVISLVLIRIFNHPLTRDVAIKLGRAERTARLSFYYEWVVTYLPLCLSYSVYGRWFKLVSRLKAQVSRVGLEFLEIFTFLPDFYHLSDLVWQEGLLIDFLQKKSVDKFARTCVIFTGYLFSERVVLDIVVRFYIDYVLWGGRAAAILEFSNITWTLFITLAGLIFMFLVVIFCYSCLLVL